MDGVNLNQDNSKKSTPRHSQLLKTKNKKFENTQRKMTPYI